MWWAAPVAGLAGSALGYLGQQSANDTNRMLAERQMLFQQRSIAEQREFEERMSSTAYQRQVADLQKAGLNPLYGLAKGMGGSSTPTVSAAQGARAEVVSPVQKAVEAGAAALNGALASARLMGEVRLLNEQADKAENEATLAGAEAQWIGNEKRELNKAEILSRTASAREASARARLSELSAPAMENFARAQPSWWMRSVAPYINSVLRLRQIVE